MVYTYLYPHICTYTHRVKYFSPTSIAAAHRMLLPQFAGCCSKGRVQRASPVICSVYSWWICWSTYRYTQTKKRSDPLLRRVLLEPFLFAHVVSWSCLVIVHCGRPNTDDFTEHVQFVRRLAYQMVICRLMRCRMTWCPTCTAKRWKPTHHRDAKNHGKPISAGVDIKNSDASWITKWPQAFWIKSIGD